MAHELAMNPYIQSKLYNEIYNVNKNFGHKKITYEILQRMTYMDQVESETLRRWLVIGLSICHIYLKMAAERRYN